jgi:cytochrome c oxidase assembly protein subunit 15
MLAFCVILLGAYTRLTDAGLGCPDWPFCYGKMIAPQSTQEINQVTTLYPHSPYHLSKARTEMTHRYFAETLGLFIVLFAVLSYRVRRQQLLPLWLPATLVALVMVQGLLGMWTVTLSLLPVVVMSHLLGGFCTLGLLWLGWLYLNVKPVRSSSIPHYLFTLGAVTLGVLFCQILLGGWTSANYAALICPDFPTCQGQWWPAFSSRAFNLLGGVGLENPLSYMDAAEKTTIHISHRLGALLTFCLGSVFSFHLWRHHFKKLSLLLMGGLLLQVGLGVSNIAFHLPLSVAVLHNGVAVILLLTLIAINYTLYYATRAHRG